MQKPTDEPKENGYTAEPAEDFPPEEPESPIAVPKLVAVENGRVVELHKVQKVLIAIEIDQALGMNMKIRISPNFMKGFEGKKINTANPAHGFSTRQKLALALVSAIQKAVAAVSTLV